MNWFLYDRDLPHERAKETLYSKCVSLDQSSLKLCNESKNIMQFWWAFIEICKNSEDMLHKMIVDCPWLSTYFYLRRLSGLQKDNSDIVNNIFDKTFGKKT